MSIYLSFFQIHNCDLIGMNSLILINSLKDSDQITSVFWVERGSLINNDSDLHLQ